MTVPSKVGNTVSRNQSDGRDSTLGIAKHDVLEQLKKIYASSHFHHSDRYKNFLRFIVESSLEGHSELLKERIIGIEVLGRSPDFDTANDPSVRVVANEVRKRLALYYSEPEHQNELQIKIPIRAYIAEFSGNTPVAESPAETAQPTNDTGVTKKRSPHRLPFVIQVAAALIVITAAIATIYFLRPNPPIDMFWAPFLKNSGSVTVCVSPHLSGNPTNGREEEHTLSYEAFRDMNNGLATADVIAYTNLAAYIQSSGKKPTIRSAQTAQLSDLNGNSVILLGSFHNTWTMRFEAEHRFHFKKSTVDGLRWIEDTNNPENRAWALDAAAPLDQIGTDYLLISRVWDQQSGQWWMDISGLTSVGTILGSQVVTDPKTIETISKNLPKGWDSKNLQMVLTFKVVQGSPGNPRLIASHSW